MAVTGQELCTKRESHSHAGWGKETASDLVATENPGGGLSRGVKCPYLHFEDSCDSNVKNGLEVGASPDSETA